MEWTAEARSRRALWTSENSGLCSKCSGMLSGRPDATMACAWDGSLKESGSKQEDERHCSGPGKTCGPDHGGSSEAGESCGIGNIL